MSPWEISPVNRGNLNLSALPSHDKFREPPTSNPSGAPG